MINKKVEGEIQRNYQIDNIRAIAILLVVIGHSIIIYSSSWGLYKSSNSFVFFDYLKDFINIIQMPIFFAVSGFLFAFSVDKKRFFEIVKDKAYRLLIPYIFFAFLWLLPIRLVVNYPGYSGKSLVTIIVKCLLYGSDNGHLWYLIALFWIFIFASIIIRFSNKHISDTMLILNFKHNEYTIGRFLFLVFSILLLCVGKIVDLYYFNSVSQYMICFALGLVIHDFYSKLSKVRFVNKIGIFTVSLLLSIICLCKRNGVIHFVLSIITAFLLIIFLFIIVPNKKINTLSYLSSVSFGVYLFHSPLVYISYTYFPDIHPLFMFFVNFALFGLVSLVLTQLFKKCKLKFAIGEYR
ncbi:acyltransferase family protein [Ruminococcus flavefaciens]|uniref:acyltransferase family protein n=1 Tax=Ruminococcus flavefaciens TaxID=1265 RepID=UPI000491368C|nr:acyltransferase [Ruminococcus flavefaciens]